MTAQWVQLRDGETLVANREGAWIQRPQAAALELRGSMPAATPGTSATTRHLLEGAIAAAEQAAPPPNLPPLTTTTWALALVDQWYTAHHSVALLPRAIDRYHRMDRSELARFAEKKLEEEAGHDLLPLDDLRALGYDAVEAVEQVPPGEMARTLVEYGYETVTGPNPVSFLGYIFALERRVIRITQPMLRLLDRELGVQAASGVRAHAAEFDRGHVDELVEFVVGLPADDRSHIALACYTTAAICWSPPCRPREVERARRLSRLGGPSNSKATEGVTK